MTEIKKKIDVLNLADEIINGLKLKREDNLDFFLNCNLKDLLRGADKIRSFFVGDYVDLCSIFNAKSGMCCEDCKFCAQSVHYKTNCNVYEFLKEDEILKAFDLNEKAGVDRFCIVTASKALFGEDFLKAVEVIKKIKNRSNVSICASMGFLNESQLKILKDCGVKTYHCNLETSASYFSNICTTHTYSMKLNLVKLVKKVGLKACSGGIFGMGESFSDRIDMAHTLNEIGVDSIPINALIPIKGTPLQNCVKLKEDEFLRIIAMFRYINLKIKIRLAAGRDIIKNFGEMAFKAGANALIVGNMLTTKIDSKIENDRLMLQKIGLKVKIN